MEAFDRSERLALDDLYEGYIEACDELSIVPLPPDHLLALFRALAERDGAMLH